MGAFFGIISSRLFLLLLMASGRPVTNLGGCALVVLQLQKRAEPSNKQDVRC